MYPTAWLSGCVWGALLATPLLALEPALAPWRENPWYWSYHDQPLLLLGGSDDDNLFQWPREKLVPHLDRLVAAGGNVVRNTMSDRQDGGWEVYPFVQSNGDKFDLNQPNPEYWERFEAFLQETADRQVFVQIEIWDRFDFTDNGGANHWQRHPYNPANNVNYSHAESELDASYPDHPGRNLQPFFYTTPAQRDNKLLLAYQQRFVNMLLDRALRYDHVLYCIDNETSGDPLWGQFWTEFIRRRATEAGRPTMITEMWDNWNLNHAQHRHTFDHPERYDFVDVSQNNHQQGQAHWDNFLAVRDYLAGKPRPMNTTKTYGADGNKFGHTSQDGIERFWRHLLAGAASIRFHRPPSGLGLNDQAVATLQAARKLESMIPLWTLRAANELLSERDENEAYLAANLGESYVVYFPSGGAVKLDLTAAHGKFDVHWIDIDRGEWSQRESLTGGGVVELTSATTSNYVAAIVRQR